MDFAYAPALDKQQDSVTARVQSLVETDWLARAKQEIADHGGKRPYQGRLDPGYDHVTMEDLVVPLWVPDGQLAE